MLSYIANQLQNIHAHVTADVMCHGLHVTAGLFSLNVTTHINAVISLFQYNTYNESWKELPTKLPHKNQKFVATLVDSRLFPPCGNNLQHMCLAFFLN